MTTLIDILHKNGIGIEYQKGQVGVEIEVEGENLPVKVPPTWRSEKDGSLRGDSREYVLRKPLGIVQVGKEITGLKKFLDEKGARVYEANRAGVHVHINVQTLTPVQLFTFYCCYIILEGALTKFCGEFREGNHFCLRVSDAEHVVDTVIDCLENGKLGRLNTDLIRYSAFNFNALFNYGSVEIRSMRSTPHFEEIVKWVDILYLLKTNSIKLFKNPREAIMEFSAAGPESFIRQLLPKHYLLLKEYKEFEEDAHNNMWIAQDIAFSRDWNPPKEKPKAVVNNPFKVNAKINKELKEKDF